MSILIKGMEMPKDGEMLCVNIYPNGKVCINLDLDCKQIATAVPVPDCGRLISAKLLKAEFTGNFQDEYPTALIHAMIDTAPTIIPAEEGE